MIADLSERDAEFDLENDQLRCLYGLFNRTGESFSPSDVLRTTKIFKNPEFFANGMPDSTQIIQGAIGDCWFLSALSAVANAPGLLEKLCVAVSRATFCRCGMFILNPVLA